MLGFSHQITLEIYRRAKTGAPEEKISFDLQQPSEKVADATRLARVLPPRQKFVLDDEGSASGQQPPEPRRGHIVVKLPVKLDERLLQQNLPSLGHFQVWRQFVWEERPTLAADFVQPELRYLEDNQRRVLLVSPYIYTETFDVVGDQLSEPGLLAGATEIRYAIKAIQQGDTDLPSPVGLQYGPPLRLYVPPIERFPKDLALVIPVQSLYVSSSMAASPSVGTFQMLSTDGETPHLAKFATDTDQQRPLLSSDFELWAEELPLAQAGFYSGEQDSVPPQAEQNGDDADPRRLLPNKLFQSTDGKFRVSVVDLARFVLTAASIDDLRARGAPGDVLNKLAPLRDRSLATVEFLAAVSAVLSAAEFSQYRQLLLDVAAKTQPATFRIDTSATHFRTGYGYRFFIRPVDASSAALLAPLPTFLVRELPRLKHLNRLRDLDWAEPPKLQLAPQIEWIPQPIVEQIRLGQVDLLLRSAFAVAPRDVQDGRFNQLGISWDAGRLADGGVEIVIQDRDDSALHFRQQCEVLDEEVFRNSVRDFSNPSQWNLTRGEQSRRRPTAPGGAAGPVVLDDFVYIDEANPAILALTRRRAALFLDDQPKRRSDGWVDFLAEAKNWVTAVYQYLRSPLNLNDANLQRSIKLSNELLKFAMLGMRPLAAADQVTPELLAQLESESTALAAHLDEIRKADPDNLDIDEADRQRLELAMLDIEMSRRCAAVMRRRLACAAEIFATTDDDVPLLNDQGDEKLPGQSQLEQIRRQWQTARRQGPLPLTDWFFASSGNRTRLDEGDWAIRILFSVVNEFLLTVKMPDTDRKEKLAAIVTKGTGLTVALNHLQRVMAHQRSQLHKRPHHQVSVGRSESGEKTAEPTRLAQLMPDATRLEDRFAVAASSEQGWVRSVVAYFNVLERLGFAVDVAASDALQQTTPQAGLLELIDQADLSDLYGQGTISKHRLFLLAGREPDAEHRGFAEVDEDFVGFAHVKLAVLPESFHDLLLTKEPADVRQWLHDLSSWFNVRKIQLGSAADQERYLRQLATIAQHLGYIPGADGLDIVRVEPRGQRWLTVPAVGGQAHSGWIVPDLKGHRYRVTVRRMSRYEPLIRWAESRDQLLQHPLDEAAEISVQRIIANPALEDAPEQLPVFIYPHPSQVRFSYQLPPAGARAIYNGISAVRTGFRGCELMFEYKILDREANGSPDPLRLENVLRDLQPYSGDRDDPGQLDDLPPRIEPIPHHDGSHVRLFRHERLLTLSDLPHYYRYCLQAASLYDARVRLPAQNSPRASDLSPFTARAPGYLAVKRVSIHKTGGGDPIQFKATFTLSKNIEHATPREIEASPPPLVFPHDHLQPLLADHMPDVAMGFHVLYEKPPEANGGGVRSALDESAFFAAFDLLLPWHAAYVPEDAPTDKPHPLVRSLHSDVSIVNPRPVIQYAQANGGGWVYQVLVEFTSAAGGLLFQDLSKVVVQASRDDYFSAPLPLKETP